MIVRASLAVVAVLVLSGCGDDPVPGDAGDGDAAGGTACGPVELCDSQLEVCVVRGPIGPGYSYTCEAVPGGCEGDRSCACTGGTYCTGSFDTCTEAPPNTITCECPQCQ